MRPHPAAHPHQPIIRKYTPPVQGHIACQNFTLRPSCGGGGFKRRPRLCWYFAIVFVIFLTAVAVSNQLHVVCRQFIRFVLLFNGHVAYRNRLLTPVL